MKPTIRNKLLMGFSGMMLLMAAVSVIDIYSVYRLRRSAQDATRIGGQLNAVALEIQVHNLEAQRRIKGYLNDLKRLGPERARETYLDEADFEIHEIGNLADRAVAIAPDEEKRGKFQRVAASAAAYEKAVAALVGSAEAGVSAETMSSYETAAEQLHENAEDGEATGRDAAQLSQEDIAWTSKRSAEYSLAVSLLALMVGGVMSYSLTRAILVPVDHLKEVAESVSMGNMDVNVRRYSEDEIGDLADSFSRMVAAVKYFRLEMESMENVVPEVKA